MSVVILGGLITGILANLIVLPVMLHVFWRPGYGRRVPYSVAQRDAHSH